MTDAADTPGDDARIVPLIPERKPSLARRRSTAKNDEE